MLIDYAYYAVFHKDENIPVSTAEFKRLARSAQAFFDAATFDRVTPETATDTIKDTICMLVDTEYDYEQRYSQSSEQRLKSSETVGKHTVSYASAPGENKSLDDRRYKIVKRMLFHTGLLYRGVRR